MFNFIIIHIVQKNILTVLFSFFGVITIILLGTTIAYRIIIIPDLKQDIKNERIHKETKIKEKDERIKQLEDELSNLQELQQKAEKQRQKKLTEEKISQEKARIAAEKKALAEAAAARKAAKKKSSKKSKAS